MKTYVFSVDMSCEGCSNAINNVLKKHKDKGIENFTVDLDKKTVEIVSSLNKEEVQEILKKTGKAVTLIEEK